MEGIVAKRCLRSSSIGNSYSRYNRSFNRKDSLSDVCRKSLSIGRKINKEESVNKSFIEKHIFNIKMKLWIQSISAMCVLIVVISVNMFDINLIDNNKYVKMIKKEYSKDYPMNKIKKGAKKGVKYCYLGLIKIVPDEVENKVKSMYLDVKKALTEDNKNDKNQVTIYAEEENKEESSNEIENDGVGVSIDENIVSDKIEAEEEKIEYETAVSTISSEDPYLQYIYDNNIEFVMPTNGTVSSSFGAREVIFEDIDSYHTGVDIANRKGTNIVASTAGTVTKVANNKYNGNFVEITNGRLITKYAHMDSVSIKQGTEVKAGDLLGYMGETGYATGPHLHFEVVIDSVKIDPSKVLDL